MTSYLLILPLLLPGLIAALMIITPQHDLTIARFFSFLSSTGLLALSLILLFMSTTSQVETYSLGNWASPFGIVLVLDRLSALMLFLTACVALGVLIYTSQGWDKKGKHFHSLFQFQLMGINGAFLTGDIFNLFVFFEVLLIASYGLMVHGGGEVRVRAGIQYVIINLIGSSLFLIAVGLIYSVLGTLNMADLALQVKNVSTGDIGILHTGAILLLLVFGIKAALVPLHLWLPGTYSNAPAPVAALFALLTKVGAYCILRVYTLIFPDLASSWLVPAALVTLVIGTIGVLAAKRLGQLVSFYMISSMGTLLLALGQFTQEAITAGLYYMLHSTFTGALLFLIVDMVRKRRANFTDRLELSPPFKNIKILSAFFFVAAIAAVGMPPLSGFLGKLLILTGSLGHDFALWIWVILLATSLLTLIGFSRAGSLLFWKSHSLEESYEAPKDQKSFLDYGAVLLFLSFIFLLTVFAHPVSTHLHHTTHQLLTPQSYIDTVLGAKEELQ